MQSPGAVPLIMLVVLVVLALDSRRLHALARSNGRTRREAAGGIPPGANPDQVGLTLRQIQMRIHVDWHDGGIGWDGPEILPADEPDVELDDASDGELGAPTVSEDTTADEQVSRTMPVLWRPFLALPPAGQSSDTGSPCVIRNHSLTDSAQKTYG